MKDEITSKEYWDLPDELQKQYQQVTQELRPYGWIDRIVYGSPNTQQLRTIYRKRGLPKNKIGNVDMYDLQEQDIANMKRHGTSNNE